MQGSTHFMTKSLLKLENFSPNLQATYDAATYFVLEALHETSDTVEFVLLEEAAEGGLFGITVGLPDRPALRVFWTFPDFGDAVAVFQEIRNLRPDARFFFSEWSEEDGNEIQGTDILRGMIAMRAEENRFDPDCEWTWLAEDAAGNRPENGRDYEPFYAAIAARLA
ncbi:hypothetical protein [Methylorubrum extorquens]|uniref:hypothetical protein n=1 Tax=Methylorubrum extorquens TaxID=408 RepID=UPI0012DB76F5|nr:hypothetical protein [Methylorubrum extorquens]